MGPAPLCQFLQKEGGMSKRMISVFTLIAGLAITGAASAQAPARSNVLVGTWTLISNDMTRPDGTKSPVYVGGATGLAIFTADGHMSVFTRDTKLPRYASN